jgi:preprotein translocase subunit SecE
MRGALSELKKVTWPSKKQTTNYSIVVIALTIGVALFFGVSDYLLNILLGLIIK